jgi:hypothetical protein
MRRSNIVLTTHVFVRALLVEGALGGCQLGFREVWVVVLRRERERKRERESWCREIGRGKG